jgi:microcystin-dependent protein
MPIDFPTSPTTGQVYTYLGNSWVYNGTGWDVPKAGSLNLENLVPPGTINQYAGAAAPTGYLLCQGQSLDTTTYGNLFNVIGYTYGGSGSSFSLPNLQNRVPVGKGPDAEFDALGETGGAKTVTLTVDQMPSHTHVQNSHNHTQDAHNHSQNSHDHYAGASANPYYGLAGFGAGWGGLQMYPRVADGSYQIGEYTGGTTATNNAATATNQATTATNQNTGGGSPHNNLQPYIVLNYIIKT